VALRIMCVSLGGKLEQQLLLLLLLLLLPRIPIISSRYSLWPCPINPIVCSHHPH